MNRPPLPANPSAKCTHRPEQNLASLASGPRGAVLLPVMPKIPQSQSWILVKRTDVSGEGCRNFILHGFLLEVLHPPHRRNRGKQIQLVNRDARKHRKIKHQNGRERRHFFGFKLPKKFLRSLPPVSSRCLGWPQFPCDTVNALSHEWITAAFTFAFTSTFHTSREFRNHSTPLRHNSETPQKHCTGLERPHFRCHGNRGGRSSPARSPRDRVLPTTEI